MTRQPPPNNKPPEYMERVLNLIDATKGASATNALTYNLQCLLDLGGYFISRNGEPFSPVHDGTPCEMTNKAISNFRKDYMRQTMQSGAGPETMPRGTIASDPDLAPTSIPVPGTVIIGIRPA